MWRERRQRENAYNSLTSKIRNKKTQLKTGIHLYVALKLCTSGSSIYCCKSKNEQEEFPSNKLKKKQEDWVENGKKNPMC